MFHLSRRLHEKLEFLDILSLINTFSYPFLSHCSQENVVFSLFNFIGYNLFVSDKDLHVVLEDEYKIKPFVDDHDYYHFDDTIEISDLKCVVILPEN